MNTLKYKDFIGSVAFSEKDNVFFGKIEGIDGLVNFEGESVAELTEGRVSSRLGRCRSGESIHAMGFAGGIRQEKWRLHVF